MDRSGLLTEQRLPASASLDTMTTRDALALMSAEDEAAVRAVAAQRDAVEQAVEMVYAALEAGGRLIYVGAGTSGRLGALDAFECPPTFGADPEQVQAIVADDADMSLAFEGAEDRADAGAAAVDRHEVCRLDVVMGIAAGGTTPFVHGALRRAKERGARTIFLCCIETIFANLPVDLYIRPLTGPEILTGSTRLKAGTATKLILNQITTLAMVRLGKVYGNLMVDLLATNSKLWDRGARIVSMLTGLESAEALEQLRRARGDVKVAVAAHAHQLDPEAAQALLARHNGRLRAALEERSIAELEPLTRSP